MQKKVVFPLSGTALVTGGSSGIGLGFCHALARRGINLVIVGRNQLRLEETALELITQYGVSVQCLTADISVAAGVETVVKRLQQSDNAISILVNNAGSGLRAPLISQKDRDLTAHLQGIDLMVKAPLILGNVAAEVFTTAQAQQNTAIVNVASVNAIVPMGSYSAMKAFMLTWSQALALRASGTKLRVLTFLPGWTRTEHHQRAGISTKNIPNFLWLDAKQITETCVRQIEQGKTYVVTGKCYKTLSFLVKHAPRSVVAVVIKKFNKGRGHVK